jgi:hypothetical protein
MLTICSYILHPFPTRGFPDDDARRLQVAFNSEFQIDKEETMRQMATVTAAKAAREAALRAQQHAETQRVAEEGAVSRDSRAAYLLKLVEEGFAPSVLSLRGLSKPAARALIRGVTRAVGPVARVEEIDAVGCGLTDNDCARAVRDLLAAQQTRLRVLRLDSNHLTSVSARELAAGLRKNKTLQLLSLEDNPLCAAGVAASGESEPEDDEGCCGENTAFLMRCGGPGGEGGDSFDFFDPTGLVLDPKDANNNNNNNNNSNNTTTNTTDTNEAAAAMHSLGGGGGE